MNWITKFIKPKINSLFKKKSSISEESLWTTCGCKNLIYKEDLKTNFNCCPKCGAHHKLSCRERFELFFDSKEFEILETPAPYDDPLNFVDNKKYVDRLKNARKITKQNDAVAIAKGKLNNIDIKVKSSFVNKPGTLITKRFKKKNFSNQIITGISSTKNDAKITIAGVKDKPGVAAFIFEPLSKNLINVDMVVQNISSDGKQTDLTFTIKSEDVKRTEKIIKENKNISYKKLSFDKNLAKISIIGVGMITTPGITYRMFKALASKKINIMVISTSEIKISVLISSKLIKKAVAVLHKEFKLD